MEQTYVMIKPDGVRRGLVGEIISRIEKRGLKLVALRMNVISGASDSPDAAAREIAIHFKDSEIGNYSRIDEVCLYE